jgi:hypothetical protein
MNKLKLGAGVVALCVLALVGVLAAGALSAPPPAPPGTNPCEHGNAQKPCKPDPSPNGKDCDEHGKGGVNEDHCLEDTTTTTTTTDTTTTTQTTTTGTTTETTTSTTPTTSTSTTTTSTSPTTPTETTTTTQTTTPSGPAPPASKPKPKKLPKLDGQPPAGTPGNAPPPCPPGKRVSARCGVQGNG